MAEGLYYLSWILITSVGSRQSTYKPHQLFTRVVQVLIRSIIRVQPTFRGGLYNPDCNSDWHVYTNLISLIQIGIQFKRLVAIHIIMTANDVAIPGSERIPPSPTGWSLRHHVTSHLRSQPENKMFCTIEVKIDDSRCSTITITSYIHCNQSASFVLMLGVAWHYSFTELLNRL